MNSLLVTGGRVIDPANRLDAPADLFIKDGQVAAIGPEAARLAPPGTPAFSAAGCVVCPGLIDLHVHLRDPGQTAKENIATGTAAAARGGIASVLCMPNTTPPIDTASTVALIHERAAREAAVNVFISGAITKGLAGEELAPLGSLKKAGVVAFTDDGKCVQSNEVMRRALEYAKMLDLPVLDHCQDYSLVSDGVAHEGLISLKLGLRGWPATGEEAIVARNIMLAEMTGARVHCQHISSVGSARLIREARKRGINITGEACPHHFTLTDSTLAGSDCFWAKDGAGFFGPEDLAQAPLPQWPSYDTNFKMNPPLRTAEDRDAVIEALKDGTLQMIASDHAPHCGFEKEVEFDYAPFGITGIETELALSLMRLYHTKMLTLPELVAKFTTGPAGLLKLSAKGHLSVGADGDLTIFDPERRWVYTRELSASKSANTPFHNWPLRGKPVATVVGGKIAWRE